MEESRLITVAIHTYKHAVALRNMLEREGIDVVFTNVNIANPDVFSGVRVRIKEKDLPLALRIIENTEVFSSADSNRQENTNFLLVPVDFSDHSMDAVKVACAIAIAHNASLLLLHSYIDPYVAGNMQLTDSLTYELSDTNSRQAMELSAKKQMEHFADRLRLMMKNGEVPVVMFDTKVVEGVPEDSIVEYAKVNPPYLIVMGTRGTSKKVKEMVGSVTAEVLDACRFSVLAIPENSIDESLNKASLENVLFLCNLDQEDILAMDSFYRIFKNGHPKVTVVNIPGKKRPLMKDSVQSMDMLLKYFRTNFSRFEFDSATISLNSIIEDINSLEKKHKVDMIVVPNKKKNVFSRLFNPGIAHKILFAADIPMLVIPV